MRRLLRPFLVVCVAGSAVIGAAYAQSGWAASLSTEWRSVCELEQTIEEQVRVRLELDEQWEQVVKRTERRRRVVAEIEAEHITLLQAAAEFRALNESLPARSSSCDSAYPGSSEGERLCRNVIRLVQIDLSERTPSLAAAKTKQLEGELQTLMKRDGIVHLP